MFIARYLQRPVPLFIPHGTAPVIRRGLLACGQVVLHAVLHEQGLHPGSDQGVSELRHRREQVVLNLEVQVCRPPIYEPRVRDVRGVVGSLLRPSDVLVGLRHSQVCMGHCEVSEDVSARDLHHHHVQDDGLHPRVASKAPSDKTARSGGQT